MITVRYEYPGRLVDGDFAEPHDKGELADELWGL
jgi:hypothetical protein